MIPVRRGAAGMPGIFFYVEKAMFLPALIIGKLCAAILKPFGRGSDLPGRIALRLCPSFLSRFRRRCRIIAVTGSNGKTGTAGMITQILRSAGKTVCTNPIGSNMTGGVATVMLKASDMRGTIGCDFLVLETDERYSRLIFADFKPDIMLVTNLFRDQITRNNNVDFIFDILNRVITPEITLVLNALDPISGRLGSGGNRKVFFGCPENPYTKKDNELITHDCKVCPVCKRRLHYDYYLYNHIGKFRCVNCGYASPEADALLEEPDLAAGTAVICGKRVKAADPTLYGLMNMTAAAAVCREAGLDEDRIAAGLNGLKQNRTRYMKFRAGGRDGVMILSKNQNPVSFDLSISEVLRMPGSKTVVAYINNINHTDHRDTTWLWDITFERLAGKADNFICAGPRAYDLAVRLKYAGFDMADVIVEPDNAGLARAAAKTSGTLCVLTELYDARTVMNSIAKGAEEE